MTTPAGIEHSLAGYKEIRAEHIDYIAMGATVLGTGGGGDPYVGSLHAKRSIRLHGPVELRDLNELDDDGLVVPIGSIGAPSVSIEKLPAAHELCTALDTIERYLGRQIAAIMPIEIGGGNSMLPIAAAAERRLPLVDADAMGRAFPEAQMVTFHLAGYGPGTTVLVDAHGNTVVSQPVDGQWSERLARALTVQMGGTAMMIDYVYPGSVVRECAIAGTLSKAFQIGQTIRQPHRSASEKLRQLLLAGWGFHVFSGKVIDIERAIEGGFTKGEAQLAGVGDFRGSSFTLCFQNEMLLGLHNGRPAAMTPDLIAVLDQVTIEPITTESLRYGARVDVVAFPADSKWRTARGLATAGPHYFGYNFPYQPVEDLALKAATA